MKRVWKPLDVKGLRLYRVGFEFLKHPAWNMVKIVAAKSPRDAAQIMEQAYQETIWIEQPIIQGLPLTVFQPESWTDDSEETPESV